MALERQDTEALVGKARGGDREAFTELYAHLAPALHAWAGLRLSPSLRSRMEPEDLLHEVWWRALDAFASFDPAKGSFRTWLFTIATRVLMNAFRRAGTASRAGLPLGGALSPSDVPVSLTDVSRRVVRDAVIKDVVTALQKMDEPDQAVFLQCGLEGLSAPAAASLTGQTAEAVKKRWQRLREKLRREIPEGERLWQD